MYTIQMEDKVYNFIYTLISDLNALMILNSNKINKLQINEIASIFSLSTNELNKLLMVVVTNSTTVTIQNTGIMFYLNLKYYLMSNCNKYQTINYTYSE